MLQVEWVALEQWEDLLVLSKCQESLDLQQLQLNQQKVQEQLQLQILLVLLNNNQTPLLD
jgi:hypothetical protein